MKTKGANEVEHLPKIDAKLYRVDFWTHDVIIASTGKRFVAYTVEDRYMPKFAIGKNPEEALGGVGYKACASYRSGKSARGCKEGIRTETSHSTGSGKRKRH